MKLSEFRFCKVCGRALPVDSFYFFSDELCEACFQDFALTRRRYDQNGF